MPTAARRPVGRCATVVIEVGIQLHEPAVALTDLAVGLEAAAFSLGLMRQRSSRPPPTGRAAESAGWFVVFFASTSVAALAGAALHGLFPSAGASSARRRLWRTSLGSIGVAALSAWCLGTAIALSERSARRVRRLAIVAHGAYLVALLRTNPPFAVAIAMYVPGSFALALALVRRLEDRTIRASAGAALAGIGLTFAAALAQLRRIAVHPRLFDHNATYHTIQAIALVCFFRAARGLAQNAGTPKPIAGGAQIGGRT